MELGTLELKIFVSLAVVLGTAFVALICDFLKGTNEQLRERNIELRARQDERERLGLHEPLAWVQGMANQARSPQLAESLAPEVSQRVEAAEPEAPARGGRRLQRERSRGQGRAATWASKEELEELAGRAARIRARHESTEAIQEQLDAAPRQEGEPEMHVEEARLLRLPRR